MAPYLSDNEYSTIIEISKPLDLVFALDTSNDVTDETIAEFKDYLKSVINAYDVSSQKVRISIVLFGSESNVVVDLKNGEDINYLLNVIDTMKRQGKNYRFHRGEITNSSVCGGEYRANDLAIDCKFVDISHYFADTTICYFDL